MKTAARILEDPATDKELRETLGPADDETIIELRNIRATCTEVQQAKMWLDDDDYIGADLEQKMNSRVRRIYEILFERQEQYNSYETG